jgi:hypothetical protein
VNGVHVDPSSPSGKEYAIPLEDARRVGEAGRTGDVEAVSQGALFGAGVTRAPHAAGRTPRQTSRNSRGSGHQSPVPVTPRYLDTVAIQDAPSTTLISGGSAALVLLIGGCAVGLIRLVGRRRAP